MAIALVIGVTGGAVLAAVAGARRTDTAYARFLRTSGAADALIAPFVSPDNPGEPGFYAAVRGVPGVTSMAKVTAISAADPRRSLSVSMVAGDELLGRAIDRPKITAGRMSDPGRPEEAVAEAPLARLLHLRPGSTLHLAVGPSTPEGFQFDRAKPVDIRVVGVGVSRDDVVAVNAQAAQPTLDVTPALLRQVTAQFASREDFVSYEGAVVRLDGREPVASFGRSAQALASRHLGSDSQLFVADEHQQAAKVERAIHPQAIALALFALLVAVTGLFVAGQLLWRQLFVASAEHPTLRALGMSRGQLVAVRLGQVGLVSAAGAVVAVVITASTSALMPIGPARVAEPHPGAAVNWAVLGLGALAIVVLLVVRVAWAAWRLGAPGASAAADRVVERPSRLVEAFSTAGAPASAAIGMRLALEPGRGGTAVPVRSAVAGTALAVAAVAAALTFGTNLVRLVETPRLYGQDWDVAVDGQFGTLPLAQADEFLRQQAGVVSWTFGNHHVATIAGHETPAIGLIQGRGPVSFPTLIEGRAPQGPGEIVLGTKTLEVARTRVGRTIDVAFQGEDAPRVLRVVGRAVFPFFGQGTFSPTGLGEGAAVLDPAPGPDGVNFFLVRMVHRGHEGRDIASLSRNLLVTGQCPADQDCGVVTAQRPADVRNYARIQSTPLALAAVLALLAVATIAHVLVTSIRRRRRDLAVLKTLGFVRRQVSAAVAWQATVLVVLALVLGLPVGVAAGRWAWQLFARRLGVAPQARVPILAVVAAVPLALLVANAVAAVPGWVAGRLRPAPVLRTE